MKNLADNRRLQYIINDEYEYRKLKEEETNPLPFFLRRKVLPLIPLWLWTTKEMDLENRYKLN